MRGKVREVEPPADGRDLEELVVEEPTAVPTGRLAGNVPGGRQRTPEPITVQRVDHGRPLAATDLGPNGDVVLDLLSRAAALTTDEGRRLEKSAAWRWGLLALTPTSGGVSVARAVALLRGRRDGRSEAIVALQAAVAAIVEGRSRKQAGSVVSACIFNAGLAVLARDLIDAETFDLLFGPWREVMHH